MHLDNLVEEIGSFGKFQIMVITLVMVPKLAIGYNMLLMTFGGYVPDWWCVDPTASQLVNTTYQYCTTENTNSTCSRVFDDHTHTLSTKWDLVCERKWITPTITSIQFGGVLLGAMVGGQMADLIGRKKTFYATLLLHSLLSIAAAFSVSWQMFAAIRFCVGTTCGSYLVVSMFPVEFIGYKWRPALTLIPFWPTGVCFLALVAWLLHDWVYVQIIAGVFTIPFLLGWFMVPESIRWLTVKGRLDEAEKAIETVARMNGKIKPGNTREILEKIRQEEIEITGEGRRKYSYLDLYKDNLGKRSVCMQIVWFCISTSYYGFAFGVGKFFGNFYLNLFLMNVLTFPFVIPNIVAMNVANNSPVSRNSNNDPVIVGQGSWSALIIICSEMYPTVIRNLGYGAGNMAARVGGILAPFIFALSDNEMVPYIIVVVILTISLLITQFLLPETLGAALEDILPGQSDVTSQQDKSQGDKQGINSL